MPVPSLFWGRSVALVPPVLFAALLLPQRKLPLLCTLAPAALLFFALSLLLLVLGLQRLLCLGTYPGLLELAGDGPLHPLGILPALVQTLLRAGRAKGQAVPVFEQVVVHLIVFGLGAKGDFAHLIPAPVLALVDADPKWVLKKHGEGTFDTVHSRLLLKNGPAENGQPRRQVTDGTGPRPDYRPGCVFISAVPIVRSASTDDKGQSGKGTKICGRIKVLGSSMLEGASGRREHGHSQNSRAGGMALPRTPSAGQLQRLTEFYIRA